MNLNATLGGSLALVHGACAQLVVAVLVAVAVLCSRAWWLAEPLPARVRRGALSLAALVYVQIVFGAITRHLLDGVAQRLHILLAFVVLGTVFWLVAGLRRPGAGPTVRRWGLLLMVLVSVQPIFGVEAWIRRFGAGTLPELVPSSFGLDVARSGHQLIGTLIFATSVTLAVFALRPASRTALGPADAVEHRPSREKFARPVTWRASYEDCHLIAESVACAAAPVAPAAEEPRPPRRRARPAADYVELTKPRIAVLVLFTVGAGVLLRQRPAVPVLLLFHAVFGTALVASGASA